MLECLIFDMDGTLYDEIDYYKSGFRSVAEVIADKANALNCEIIFNTLWDIFTSGNHTTTFNAALARLDIAYDEKFIRRLILDIRCHKPGLILPDETKTVLETLQAGYILALLTDGFLPAQKLKVQALDIEKYFQYLIYTEEIGREYWKPCQVGFEKILNHFDVAGTSCVYVGDDLKKDFIAPNKLGFKTVHLIRPNRLHKSEAPDENAKPDYVIKSLIELPTLLKEMENV